MKAAILALAALTLTPAAVGPDVTRQAVGFICRAEQTPAGPGPSHLVISDGIGAAHWPIRTASPEAQRWFDYGLNLYHAFYHEEAKAAFKRAMALDPGCAMCAWGEALSLGETLNFPVSAEQAAQALEVANKAAALAAGDDEKSRALIAALQARYSKDPKLGEGAFRRAMDDMARRWPDDDALADVAANAVMIPSRNDDFSTAPRAMAILEPVLRRRPNDVAAIHYYIHATEFAGRPELALPYAERLPRLAPRASHLVHMGSHTFIHLGGYERSALLNARAMDIDAEFARQMGYDRPLGAALYYPHNQSFGLAGALLAGDRTLALKFADHARRAFPPNANLPRGANVIARGYIAYGRFDPQRALAIPEPGASDPVVLSLYRHYARGEAFATRGETAGVFAEADALKAVKIPPDQAVLMPIATLARAVLTGRGQLLQGHPELAAKTFADAAAVQEKAFAKDFDPPPWWYPLHRSEAAALLAAGRYQQAQAAAQKSLAELPADGLALRVLAEAQAKLGCRADARKTLAAARADWRDGDPARLPLALI